MSRAVDHSVSKFSSSKEKDLSKLFVRKKYVVTALLLVALISKIFFIISSLNYFNIFEELRWGLLAMTTITAIGACYNLGQLSIMKMAKNSLSVSPSPCSSISIEESDFDEILKRANSYIEGFIKCEYNPQKGFELYIDLANKGYVKALRKLGFCYINGIGVEKDEEKGFKLYQEAVQKGDKEAYYELSKCYTNGIGVTKCEKTGFNILLKASEETPGQDPAFYIKIILLLAIRYEYGTGTQKDPPQALALYKKAATLGSPDALEFVHDQEPDWFPS